MTYCSINVVEMRALVSSLISAQDCIRSQVSGLQSTMQAVMLDTSTVSRATKVEGWVDDELVPTRRRLAMAEALAAASPDLGNFVQFDESVISTRTPAQAAADAKRAISLMNAGDTKGLLALLGTEGYDPYFAKVFAQSVTPRQLEAYIGDNFGQGQLRGGVDPKQYETVLTGLAQTLGLATRGQGDLSLGKGWTDNFLQYMTAPRITGTDAAAFRQQHTDMALRSALMLLVARGQWSTPFLQEATRRVTGLEKMGQPFLLATMDGEPAVTPQGKPFIDPMVALMAALSHNPEAAHWAFTQGGTKDMPLNGRQVPVNSFLHLALLDHRYFNDNDRSVALLALRAAIGGDKFNPVALDVQTITSSLAEQKKHWDDMPWYDKWGHTILDVIGMIPVVGDIANVPNAAWYTMEGDWADAGITAAGSIPFLGDAALGARVFARGGKLARELEVIRVVDLTGKDIVDGVDTADLLRKATQIEPAVFRFDNLDDFRLAANAPHPNVVYEFQGIRYTTDEFGRTVSIAGTPLKTRGLADSTLRTAIGKGADAKDGDVGFHLWAESFGGHTTKLNVVPGNGKVDPADFAAFKNLNTSEYAKMENQVRAALKDPNVTDVHLTVEPVYAGTDARPLGFTATVKIDGKIREFRFKNTKVPR